MLSDSLNSGKITSGEVVGSQFVKFFTVVFRFVFGNLRNLEFF